MTTLLLIDSQPKAAQALKDKLGRGDEEVLVASDFETALRLLHRHPVSLILADSGDPPGAAYQFYRLLKKDPRLDLIPFILLSDYVSDGDLRYARSVGIRDHLSKSILAEDLLAIVQGELEAGRRLQERVVPKLKPRPAAEVLQLSLQQRALQIDCRHLRVWLGEQELTLTPRETLLLIHLARRPNEIVGLQDLFLVTHGLTAEEANEAGRLVRPVVGSLRRKLAAVIGEQACIRNIRGQGYILLAD